MGLIVPGSTLMYGSSLSMVTLRPRDSKIAAREAEAIPLPREDTTPPVTNTNLVIADGAERHVREIEIIPQTWPTTVQIRGFLVEYRTITANRKIAGAQNFERQWNSANLQSR